MKKILAVANQKGGVGKTTLAAHLAMFASEMKKKTLIIDLDEGDLSILFPPVDRLLEGVGYFFHSSDLFLDKSAKEIRAISEYLHIIESDLALLDVDENGEMRLRNTLRKKPFTDYDCIIIDTPPNLQWKTIAALTAADAVVTPYGVSPLALARLPKLNRTVRAVQRKSNPDLKHIGFFAMRINARSTNELQVVKALQSSNENYFSFYTTERACVPMSAAQRAPVWDGKRSNSQVVAGQEMRAICKKVFTLLDKE